MNSSLLSSVLLMMLGGNLGLFHQSRFLPLLVHGSLTPVTCIDEAPCVYEFLQTNCTDLMFYNDIFGDDDDAACCALQDTEAGTCTVTTAIGGRCSIHGRPGKSCSAAVVTGGVEQPYPCVPGNVVVIESILLSGVTNSSVTSLECPVSPYDPLSRPPSIFDEFPKSTLRLAGVTGTMNESEAYFVLETTKRHILSFYDQSDSVRELIVDVSLYPIMPTMMMLPTMEDNTTTAAAVMSYLLLGSYRGVEGAFRLNDPFVGEAVVAPYLAALKAAGGPLFSTLTGITHTIEPAAVRLWTFLELEGLMGLPSSGNGDWTAWTETTQNHILAYYEDSDAVVDLMFEIENLMFDTTADNTTTVSFEIFGSYRGSKTALELNDPFTEDAVGPYLAAVNALDGPFFGTLTGISFDVPAPITTTPAPSFVATGSSPATPTTNAPIMAKPPTAKTAAPMAAPIVDNASSTSAPVRARAELMPTAKPAAAPVVDAATTPDETSSSYISLPGTIPQLVLLPIGLLLWQQLWHV